MNKYVPHHSGLESVCLKMKRNSSNKTKERPIFGNKYLGGPGDSSGLSRECRRPRRQKTAGELRSRGEEEITAAGNEYNDVDARFDRAYDGAKTKLVTIKETSHRASVCPVIVEGSEKAVQFAWCVGVGELTGSGFGALK